MSQLSEIGKLQQDRIKSKRMDIVAKAETHKELIQVPNKEDVLFSRLYNRHQRVFYGVDGRHI
ncbi:MAG TPA: hypothetical protein VIO11_04620 [Candidatus Methanoperedens sp.]